MSDPDNANDINTEISPETLSKFLDASTEWGKIALTESKAIEQSRDDHKDEVKRLTARAQDFDSPILRGLRNLAGTFQQMILGNRNGFQPQFDGIAAAAARMFEASSTARGAASSNGGTRAAYATIISGGNDSVELLKALQDRRQYWREQLERLTGNDEKTRAARETAMRYIQTCGQAPEAEGGPVVFVRNGRVVKAKHYGRPSRHINGVDIPWGGATNTLALAALAARLMRDYGNAVLMPGVLDAILDNGGKVEIGMSAADHAVAALRHINALLEDAKIGDSPIGGPLRVLSETLANVAKGETVG